MARKKLDKHKEKRITSIRLDDRDKEMLQKNFGSVQMAIDIWLFLLEKYEKHEIKSLVDAINIKRSKQE